ncbi:hypothetical protein TCAL_07250 [Tigriopus californicus]|uniref:Tumor protein D54 n=1 Tax=Tigriopus californicus TaxID=6832 RepID=A0A553NSZ3_TIGCA|nr:uncharacterized protein F13E6.1-like [Tigriopus californicus]TRY68540.1 hypothetical protein TCAL_07250 [Tigriopus californicus]
MSATPSPAVEATPGPTASSYPDLSDSVASPTDSVIAGDFGAMSAEEQELQRQEWKSELAKTEEEILTLKQVLASKEEVAAGLKRRLGITAWRELSEDMTQGLKNIQDSAAYKKTAEGINVAKEKTAGLWTSVTSSTSFQNVSGRMGSAFGAAAGAVKSKMPQSMSTQGLSEALGGTNNGTATPSASDSVSGGTLPTTPEGDKQA